MSLACCATLAISWLPSDAGQLPTAVCQLPTAVIFVPSELLASGLAIRLQCSGFGYFEERKPLWLVGGGAGYVSGCPCPPPPPPPLPFPEDCGGFHPQKYQTTEPILMFAPWQLSFPSPPPPLLWPPLLCTRGTIPSIPAAIPLPPPPPSFVASSFRLELRPDSAYPKVQFPEFEVTYKKSATEPECIIPHSLYQNAMKAGLQVLRMAPRAMGARPVPTFCGIRQEVLRPGYCLVGQIPWVLGYRDGWVGWPQIPAV